MPGLTLKPPTGISPRSLGKARTLSSEKLGAWFEQETQTRLKWFQENQPLFWHRFPDTKSAGNIISAQPSDFLVATPKAAFLVEVKASLKHRSLRGCLASNVRMEQAVKSHLWVRAKHTSVFIFIDVLEEQVEVWNGGYVSLHRRKGIRMRQAEGVTFSGKASEYTELLDNLFFKVYQTT